MSKLRNELSLVGKRLVCRSPSNIRQGLILGFTQLVPCLHEDAGQCEDDASAKTKFQLRNELFLVGKRLVCKGPSNIRLVLILSFIQQVPCLYEEAWPLCRNDEALPISEEA
ncbi:hypothetical protein Adt_18560 [Abeliophyllum distichum]|uniref:Uncharacterized protein n=1 Tax=Abeliophyllum distichum TaxID=126358 RepID=A0ABD1TKJ7_9LAMI